MWIHYPGAQAPLPVQQGDIFKATAELRTVQNEIASLAFSLPNSGKGITLEQARMLYSQLTAWYENLPPSMSVNRAITPIQLALQSVTRSSSENQMS
jgi:hypothetical protein